MKSVILLLFWGFVFVISEFEFKDGKIHDFGKVKVNSEVTYDFEFKNTSKEMIRILNLTTTCGCTVADYPKEVKAGEVAKIKAKYNSGGSPGVFKKYITVFTTGKEEFIKLTIHGEVIL